MRYHPPQERFSNLDYFTTKVISISNDMFSKALDEMVAALPSLALASFVVRKCGILRNLQKKLLRVPVRQCTARSCHCGHTKTVVSYRIVTFDTYHVILGVSTILSVSQSWADFLRISHLVLSSIRYTTLTLDIPLRQSCQRDLCLRLTWIFLRRMPLSATVL